MLGYSENVITQFLILPQIFAFQFLGRGVPRLLRKNFIYYSNRVFFISEWLYHLILFACEFILDDDILRRNFVVYFFK